MTTLDEDQRAIARRQAIAESLMKQGAEPLQTNEMAGGYVVPVSPLAGVSKVAQQLAGAYIGKKADERASALSNKKNDIIKALYSGKTAPSISDVANSGVATSDELFKMAAADRAEQQKVHREGIPAGFNPTPEGGLSPMQMPGGKDYSQFLLEQAGAKAQIPGYGDEPRLRLAQEAAARDEARLRAEQANKTEVNWQTVPDATGALKQVNPKTGEVRDIGMQGKSVEKPLTEFQGKSVTFGTRAQEAHDILNKVGGDYSPEGIAAASGVENVPGINWIANKALSKNSQEVLQAQRNFVNATLRQESGATISDKEFANAKKQYFQQPGDGPDVIAQKAANRDAVINGFKVSSGTSGAQHFNEKPRINVDISPNTSAEDRAALAADIAKEQKKAPKILRFNANGEMVQ